jgi:hypothetical protein
MRSIACHAVEDHRSERSFNRCSLTGESRAISPLPGRVGEAGDAMRNPVIAHRV